MKTASREKRLLELAILAVLAVSAGWLAAGELRITVPASPGREPQQAQTAGAETKAPPTRTDNVVEALHGVEVVDPYRWLENQDAPETRAWIEAQNAYTDSLLKTWPGREQLRERIAGLLKIDFIGTPVERNGRYIFFKRLATQDQSVLHLRKGPQGEDEVLIDPNPMSPDHTTTVTLMAVARDGTLLAYGIRQGGADEVSPNLFDVDARKDLADRLPKARYFGVAILPDKTALYYARMTPEGPRVFRHKIGTEAAQDVEVFGQGYGPEKIIASGVSEDGRYLLIHVLHGSAGDRTEVYLQDLTKPGSIVPIVNDIPARFFADPAGDHLFLQTNWKAARGRVLAVNVSDPAREHWREVIPEGEAVVESVSVVGGRLCVEYTQNAITRLKLFTPEGKLVREIALPTIGTASGLSGRWSSNEAFYSFNSFHIPTTIYRYDVEKGTQEVWARLKVPIQSDRYEVKQVWYTSRDDTRVPMFVAHRKGIKLDGSHPTLLTGYGGFNATETASYGARAAAWLASGGVFALANLRGGGEFGEEWHRAGMLDKKQNVFDDFIAAAEWLIQNGYTRPERLSVFGNSNGGLLVGAALTQRPELFAAVVCGFPLLDMLRYHKFLVARFWVPEYGSADDPEQFKYLYAYSPYHRVKPGTKYPAVLFVSGDSDTRVAPLHARKMAALLQAANASRKPILLRYDTKAGHAGGTPVSKQIENLTDDLSFLLWQLGVPLAKQAHGH